MKRSSVITVMLYSTLLICAGTSQAFALSSDEMNAILQDGNYMFRRANEISRQDPWQAKDLYVKAAVHFESLAAEGGIRNGRLFYNIGNAYFMAGDIGRAILNYRRALTLIPADANLNQNLAFARSKKTDTIDEKEASKITRVVFFWHYDMPAAVRLIVFLVLFSGFWVFMTIHLFVSRPFFARGALIACVLAIVFLGSLIADTISQATMKPGVVIDTEVVARKGDGETYEPSFLDPLHAGTEFNLVESRRGWLHIELADGRRCWVPEKTAGLVD